MADGHYASKRKYDEPSPPRRRTGFSSGPLPSPPPAGAGAPAPGSYNSVPPPPDEIQQAKQRAQEIAARIFNQAEAKRPRVDSGDEDDAPGSGGGGGGGGSLGGGSGRSGGVGLGFSSSAGGGGGGGHGSAIPSYSSHASAPQYSSYGGYQGTSKKIEIPSGRVGVIIGKSGDTIKNLQLQSGAKIQVTRDGDAEPGSQTRPVELSGTPEQISRAEQLINDVLAEADSASSGAVSGRKYAPPGADQFQMQIANNKVGLVIGKGGETIKSMQAKSGARIQVIPLHLPPGDTSSERTVYIDGTAEQIESAKQLVIEVTSENRARNPMSGGYSQQGYRPPRPQGNWGQPGAPQMQQPGYGYMQPGAYPGAPPQYGAPQQPYGSYPPASGGYQAGWDQSSNQQSQQTPPGSYDYYSQQQQPQQQQSAPGTTAPADTTSYNYSQPPTYASQGYGDTTYSQQSGGQQAYGQDYSGYQTQGQQQGYSQQTGCDQQGYSTSGYAAPAASTPQDGSAPSYGGQGVTSQASPGQQTSAPATASHQGYSSQPPTSAASSYPSQGSAPQSGYGAPPPAQPGYGSTQPPAQGGYGQAAYGQPPQGQKPPTSAPYGQAPPPGTAPAGYGQYGYSQSQPGYGAPPPYPGAPSASHPGYGQQQSYGDPYASGGYGQQPAAYPAEGAAAVSQDQSASAPSSAAGGAAAPPARAPDSSGGAQSS